MTGIQEFYYMKTVSMFPFTTIRLASFIIMLKVVLEVTQTLAEMIKSVIAIIVIEEKIGRS